MPLGPRLRISRRDIGSASLKFSAIGHELVGGATTAGVGGGAVCALAVDTTPKASKIPPIVRRANRIDLLYGMQQAMRQSGSRWVEALAGRTGSGCLSRYVSGHQTCGISRCRVFAR